MSDQFVGEIRIFPGDFAPTGWAQCNGQLMPLSQNTALYSLLGTVYGGDGKNTFALPDLRSRAPLQQGQGPGLSNHPLGQVGGTSAVTLLQSEVPSHSHQLMHSGGAADASTPAPEKGFARTTTAQVYAPGDTSAPASPQALAPNGSSSPHNNMQPYLVLNFCIALQGIYPPRP
ncbi:tail fiber protein [Massilia sp.]|uniref:phage tail protein n=1 Tax=Massilia sp. TaxID=1882437 RepID=UPI0028A5D073|nr:tail fiber protein [Massilia sp.]